MMKKFISKLKKIIKEPAGFTLVEMIIAVFIFSILALEVGGIFVQVLNLERRGFAAQKMQENALFALEMMSREIRVSIISNEDSPDCSLTSLVIEHPVNGTVTYSLSDGMIYRRALENGEYVSVPITSPDVAFTRFNFCVSGSELDLKQPRVTILASLRSTVQGNSTLKFDLQTTVTSRDLRNEFQD